ncbi:hypothetical protein ACFQL1_03805 [Halomicroarcula sp. GCM10025709]|uniref:hypothetical protein n=1 Tax=Halomicroarcula sp. GCM10025709 TaxID=3252669 RepID=UPI00360D5C23
MARPLRDAVAGTLPFGALSAQAAWWLAILLPALSLFVWGQLGTPAREHSTKSTHGKCPNGSIPT